MIIHVIRLIYYRFHDLRIIRVFRLVCYRFHDIRIIWAISCSDFCPWLYSFGLFLACFYQFLHIISVQTRDLTDGKPERCTYLQIQKARTAQRSMHSMIRTQGHKRNTTIPAKRNKKSEQGRERLTPCTLCTSLSYISLSDTSMKHLSRMPAGMKYSAAE